MHKINFPVVDVPLDFGEYAEPLKGQMLLVRVNPSRAMLNERDRLAMVHVQASFAFTGKLSKKTWFSRLFESARKKTALATIKDSNNKLGEWFCQLWTWPEGGQVTKEELEEMEKEDPAFTEFITRRTLELITEHRSGQKKA